MQNIWVIQSADLVAFVNLCPHGIRNYVEHANHFTFRLPVFGCQCVRGSCVRNPFCRRTTQRIKYDFIHGFWSLSSSLFLSSAFGEWNIFNALSLALKESLKIGNYEWMCIEHWHSDAVAFMPCVASISSASHCIIFGTKTQLLHELSMSLSPLGFSLEWTKQKKSCFTWISGRFCGVDDIVKGLEQRNMHSMETMTESSTQQMMMVHLKLVVFSIRTQKAEQNRREYGSHLKNGLYLCREYIVEDRQITQYALVAW